MRGFAVFLFCFFFLKLPVSLTRSRCRCSFYWLDSRLIWSAYVNFVSSALAVKEKAFPAKQRSVPDFLWCETNKQPSSYLHRLRSDLFTLPVPGEPSPTIQTAFWPKKRICNLYLYPASEVYISTSYRGLFQLIFHSFFNLRQWQKIPNCGSPSPSGRWVSHMLFKRATFNSKAEKQYLNNRQTSNTFHLHALTLYSRPTWLNKRTKCTCWWKGGGFEWLFADQWWKQSYIIVIRGGLYTCTC